MARTTKTVKFVTLYANPYHLAVLAKMSTLGQLDLVQLEFPYVLPEGILSKLSGVPLVLDQHGVEVDFVRELASSMGVKLSRADLLRVFLIESVAVKLASLVLCCSQQDLQRMSSIYGGGEQKYALVENGVDESFFEWVEPYHFRRRTVLYVGSFDHAPNRHAISWILTEIAPRVRRAVPEVQFAFVGSTKWTTPPLLERALVFTNIPDIRPFIRGANVALSTVLRGSGTRMKTLEYLACGAPVVSTTKGVEGYDLRPGTDLVVADDTDGVADSIIELLKMPERARDMGLRGQQTVRDKYTWKDIVHKSRGIYERLLDRRYS